VHAKEKTMPTRSASATPTRRLINAYAVSLTNLIMFGLIILIAAATGDSAWGRTRQQCSVAYARCLNRAIDTGRGEKTLVNCDTMASNCFKNATDPVKKTTIQMNKSQLTTTPASKVKALERGKSPVVYSGSIKRR
jgi:hypothetical protein